MQLKNYQQQALEQLEHWLDALKEALKDREDAKEFYGGKHKEVPPHMQNYPASAWASLKEHGVLPGFPIDGNIVIPDHISRTATSGEPIPHICLKIPTGGGKTLLGVAALERIKQDTGFVLWIVPTKAIYEQTIQAFKTREHPYRQLLERISGGKVKLLQKTDRFTKQDVESQLCVMMLMLPSANRQKNKEFLKIFRDSGGYTSFFPEQDDAAANDKLSAQYPDLEKNASGDWVKQSLINTLKLIRPTVILDEAHKAYGDTGKNKAKLKALAEFVKSVNRLNPCFVLELSATPKIGISNILVNISGTELQAEEMIKLPIEIHSFGNSDWQHTLAETQKKLKALEAQAGQLRARENRYVRPIALVRVTYTGKSQRDKPGVHAEDARKYLIQNLAVPENQIRIQSSEQKELAGEDLLSEMSAVRWIITKDALKEGWDCSFAYALALLDNTTAKTAITQMVGRVMRQPHARIIKKNEGLNRCYIYCYNRDVGEAVEWVKSGLESEGLTGLGDFIGGQGGGADPRPKTIKRRAKYKKLEIFLPKVLHKAGSGWCPIDYDRDILSAINWDEIDAGEAVNLGDENTILEITATVDIQGSRETLTDTFDAGEQLHLDYFVRRLIDMVPNPWQVARMAERFLRKHKKHDATKLLYNRMHLSEVMRRRVKENIDTKAEEVFRGKVGRNEIRFHLETDTRLNYELNKSFEVFVSDPERSLQGEHGRPIQQSLFDPVYESGFNGLEKDFALYLDTNNAIYWWHRIAARQAYSLQGWRRQRIYPDFVACRRDNGTLLILETKGMHLKGNEDTDYKKQLLDTLEKTYSTALERGTMEVKEPPPPARFRMMFEDTWKEKMNEFVSDNQ